MQRAPAEHIVRAVLALARRLRSERPAGGPSLSAIGVLSTLHRAGAMPATQLAVAERLQPQSLTRIIAGLERAGWIVRKRNPADRRELWIAVTRKGERVLGDEVRARQAWLARAMASILDPAERATLLAAAGAMLKLAGHDGETPRKRPREERSSPGAGRPPRLRTPAARQRAGLASTG
jgi:DNA-binding MarR family transcriptional regulator